MFWVSLCFPLYNTFIVNLSSSRVMFLVGCSWPWMHLHIECFSSLLLMWFQGFNDHVTLWNMLAFQAGILVPWSSESVTDKVTVRSLIPCRMSWTTFLVRPESMPTLCRAHFAIAWAKGSCACVSYVPKTGQYIISEASAIWELPRDLPPPLSLGFIFISEVVKDF